MPDRLPLSSLLVMFHMKIEELEVEIHNGNEVKIFMPLRNVPWGDKLPQGESNAKS